MPMKDVGHCEKSPGSRVQASIREYPNNTGTGLPGRVRATLVAGSVAHEAE